MKTAHATDAHAPALSEFFDDAPAADSAAPAADYDFFGDSHFTPELTR